MLWMASNPRSSIQRPAPPARAVRSKASPAKRPAGATPRAPSSGDDADACRVRVAVRLRPRNNEDLHFEADCVELQPELRRLKLRKNNWISESYKFDEVFTENASQKRVYQVVAKPVVESVLNGFNGTVMAYGQTGTGKTYTIGRLGKSDQSERGIMVRAMEDILVDTSSAADTVAISYLQIYLESIQDLLAPEKKNIAIVDDPRTGQVFLPGAAVITVRDLDHFQQLLQIGESNRHVANTTMNTESSRSHAILMVYIQRSSKGKEECENIARNEVVSGDGLPVIIKSKLLIVDLAGSERIDKSGSEGHMLEEAKFINLSLTSLGKCINALSENSPHIPTRDSKLTRLLHDSFGGSARASLIITIGPSARYYAETASTIMFGQRAMKVVNMVKYKVEFDYESQCRKLQEQVDSLTEESERQQKFRSKEKEQMEEKLKICENSLAELEKNLTLKSEQHQLESFTYQKTLVETAQKYEERIADLTKQLEDMHVRYENSEDHLTCVQKLLRKNEKLIEHYQMEHSTYQKMLVETTQMCEKIIADLSQQLEEMNTSFANPEQPFPFDNGTSVQMVVNGLGSDKRDEVNIRLQEMDKLRVKLRKISELNMKAVVNIRSLRQENSALLLDKGLLYGELRTAQQKLIEEERQMRYVEDEMNKFKALYMKNNADDEVWKSSNIDNVTEPMFGVGAQMSLPRLRKLKETKQRDTITKILEEGMSSSLIIPEIGLEKVLALLRSEDLDIQIHAAKVVANLAAEGMNQEQIIHKGGAQLLANIAFKTDDAQTMRVVAGAIANLCGNEKVHSVLKEDGGIKAILAMTRYGNSDVIAQVARGLANFAKCESRGIARGWTKGKSLLINEGALEWLITMSATASGSTRRHIDLALCHLAQNGDNMPDIMSSGGIKELFRLSQDTTREDICNLAKKILNLNPTFLAGMEKPNSAT